MELQKILRNRQNSLHRLRSGLPYEIETDSPTENIALVKKKGIFYTPKAIATYICFQTLNSYLLHHLGKPTLDLDEYLTQSSTEELHSLLRLLDSIKVLDPACGAGVFLIEMAEMLFRLKKMILGKLNKIISEFDLKSSILLNNIYGVDLFEDAVEQTKANLLHWLNLVDNLGNSQIWPFFLDWNIRVGNSLIGWLDEDIGQIQIQKASIQPLQMMFQYALEHSSPVLKEKIQNYINLIQNRDIYKVLEIFYEIKNLFKTPLNAVSSILEDLLQTLHNQLYNRIDSCFIKSIISNDLSEKEKDLLLNEIKTSKPFHWNVDFGEIMNNGGFDLILGNPPYIFTRGMNFSSYERIFFKEKFLLDQASMAKGKARQSQKFNTFSLFIIRSIALLKKDHFLGFIVPNTLLRTTTNDSIRQFILEKAFIQEITDLEGDIFKGITAATILLFLQRRSNSTDSTLINFKVRDLLNFQFESHYVNQTNFSKNPVFAFNIHLDSEFESLFQLMKKNTVELGQLTQEIIEGIVCRKSDNLFTDNHSHPLAKKLLRGKDIDRYQIKWKPTQYIIYATDTTLTKTKLHRPRPQWVHEAPEKLLTQRIGGGVFPLRVAYDNSQYYTFASINNIILKNPPLFENTTYLSKYILAILNSKLLNAYYLLNFSNKSVLTVNISKTYLESLPIKKSSLEIQNFISTLVDYLLFLSSAEHEKTEEHNRLCNFFDSYLLDSLIYAIYFPEPLESDLCKLVSEDIVPLPEDASIAVKIIFLSELCQKFQDNSLVTQAIERIRKRKTIQKVEDLLQTRSSV